MNIYNIEKVIPITENTNSLTIPDIQTLQLFLNNSLLHKGIDYIILEDDIVQFNTLLTLDDILISQVSINSNKSVISQAIQTRSLYIKNAAQSLLKNNTQYKIHFLIQNKEFTASFLSQYSPFYLTTNPIGIVRGELGKVANGLSDTAISAAIYNASVEFDNKLLINSFSNTLDATGELLREMWVKYKTCFNLLDKAYVEKAMNNGSERKKIGNIEIQIDTKIPYYSDLMSNIKRNFDSADYNVDTKILAINTIGRFVKAGNTPYPLNGRTW